MFLFQPTPVDTSAYMIAGYSVVFSVMFVYVLSLFLRRRSLQRDMEVLTSLDEGDEKSKFTV
ncbi:MAG: CcmD family protein [Chloroflexota bacterium]